MKNALILLFFFSFTFQAFSQLEIPSTTRKPVFERPATTGGMNSILLREQPKEDFKFKEDPNKPKPFDIRTKSDLLTAGDYIQKKWSEDKKAQAEFGKDQIMGSFKTKGSFVELYSRDHQYVDGDVVRVFVNGVVVKERLVLVATYSPILVKLESGFNTIEFEALNQGTSGPNTAELKVFDEQGKLVTSKEWNLLTGAKASLIVVKE